MIEVLRAFVWLRWRQATWAFRHRGRGTLEETSRVLAVILPVLLILMVLPSALILAGLAFYTGTRMGRAGDPFWLSGVPQFLLRVALLALLALMVLSPMVRSSLGRESGGNRLLLLPIHRAVLHGAQALSGLGDPWLVPFLPALLLLPLGFVVGGAVGPGVLGLAASMLLVVFLLVASLCSALLMSVIFRDRRRAELVTLGMACVLVVSGILPLFFDESIDTLENQATRGDLPLGEKMRSLDAELPLWARLAPTELGARAMLGALDDRVGTAILSLVGLAAWTVALYAISWRLHRRIVEHPESLGPRSRKTRRSWSWRRLPRLDPASAAIAWTTAITTLRTVRGKMMVYLNFIMLGGLFLILRSKVPGTWPEFLADNSGVLVAGAGVLLSLISAQTLLFNQFATEGPGLNAHLLSPVTTRQLVTGKLAACALLWVLASALCVAVALILAPGGSFLLWLWLVPMGVSGFCLIAPAGVMLSAIFPKAANLNALGQDGNLHPAGGIVGTFLPMFACAPAAGLGLLALTLLGSPLAALLATSIWAAASGGFFLLVYPRTFAAVESRLEEVRLVATGH